MKLEQAKLLTPGTILYHNIYRNASVFSPARYKVNGQPKVWKRDPGRVRIPVKRGLWEFGYVTECNIHEFSLTEREAEEARKRL